MFTLSPESISAIVGLALSVAFYVIPPLRAWWDTYASYTKRALMLLLCVIASIVIALANCSGLSGCLEANVAAVITNALLAWGASQLAYGAAVELDKWRKAEAEKAKQ